MLLQCSWQCWLGYLKGICPVKSLALTVSNSFLLRDPLYHGINLSLSSHKKTGWLNNKYECTVNQELQWANDVTRTWHASGQPTDAAAYAAESGGRRSWPPSWKYDVVSEIQPLQSIHIYLENNPAKFHPNPVWNDRALGFLNSIFQRRTARKTRWVVAWD